MAYCRNARFHAKAKCIALDVGVGRFVFRRAIAWRLIARPQGCGVPGWVGPGRKGWFLKVRHPACDPFCTIPVPAAPESDAMLFNRTPVGWLVRFPRFRLPDLSIDKILTYVIYVDMIVV